MRAGCAEFLSGDVTFYGFGGGLDSREMALTMEFVVSVFPVLALFSAPVVDAWSSVFVDFTFLSCAVPTSLSLSCF